MGEMKIKHYIITRFLCCTFGCYEDVIFEPSFIHYNAGLLKNNFIKTLENQTNQNFEIIICIHNDIDIKLLKDITDINTNLKIHIIRYQDIDKYLNNIDHSEYDYVICSKMDDDDFIAKNVVQDIQNQCLKLDSIPLHVYGFNCGYAGFEDSDRVVEFDCRFDKGHFSCMQNFIFNMKLTNTLFSPYNTKHTEVVNYVENYYKDNNLVFHEKDIISWGYNRCFVWYRHKFTATDKKGSRPVINSRFLLKNDVKINKADYGWS